MKQKKVKFEPPDKEYCQHIIQLLNVTQEAIKKVGFRNLINKIQQYVENSNDPQKKEIETKILILVSEEFTSNLDIVTVEDILYSEKRGDVITAKKLTYVLFNKQLRMSQYSISKYFNRSAPTIKRAVDWFKGLDENFKSDKKILTIYNNVSSKINDIKTENFKNKNKLQTK